MSVLADEYLIERAPDEDPIPETDINTQTKLDSEIDVGEKLAVRRECAATLHSDANPDRPQSPAHVGDDGDVFAGANGAREYGAASRIPKDKANSRKHVAARTVGGRLIGKCLRGDADDEKDGREELERPHVFQCDRPRQRGSERGPRVYERHDGDRLSQPQE